MARSRLSGKVGAALDPCAAIQVPFDVADGQEREIIFILGVGRDANDAGKLVRRFRGSAAARRALEEVWQYWNHTLGAVQVETPVQSVNFLTNGCFCTKRSHAVFGPGPDTTSQAAPLVSATNCRT